MLARPPRKRSVGNVFERGLVPYSARVALPLLVSPFRPERHSSSSAPGMFRKLAYAKHLYAGFRDRVIVLDRAAAHSYGPNENPILIDDRQSAREGNQPVIRVLDTVKRFARLGQFAELAGRHAKETRGLCLLDGNIYAPDPGVVHTEEGF